MDKLLLPKKHLSINSTTRNPPKKKLRDVHKAIHVMNRNVYYNVVYSYNVGKNLCIHQQQILQIYRYI